MRRWSIFLNYIIRSVSIAITVSAVTYFAIVHCESSLGRWRRGEEEIQQITSNDRRKKTDKQTDSRRLERTLVVTMKNLFSIMGLSFASSKGDSRRPSYNDSRRASYSAVPADHRRRSSAARRQSYGANRRKSLDPAAVLGRSLFDGRLTDPRTRLTCKYKSFDLLL